MADETPMPKYRCHKEVWALKIKRIELLVGGPLLVFDDETFSPLQVDGTWAVKHDLVPGGYYVVYEDGYKSFSPAKAFEDGYTRIANEGLPKT